MTDVLKIETFNFDAVQQAFRAAPDLAAKYLKTEMLRATKRVRKRFMAQRLNGPPGINSPEARRNRTKHIRFWTAGNSLDSLQSGIRISRFLGIHETGGVITAKHKGRQMLRVPIGKRFRLPTRGGVDGNRIKGLFLLRRKNAAPLLVEKVGEEIIPRFVLKDRVVMKARLGFAETVRREWPKEFPKLNETLQRAMRVAMEQRMQRASAFVQRLVA
jgi:hypothetical protein